ncbi:TetR/AcrR family transcriptional regulator [Actinomyces vulturis]|uniref:TetR/AcrR family transcriptional regulator n=1 Tax=Actinomyces vulturis TaxID=1857645 RepID=UPI0008326296|nr:TetR/AcrR family transcriptional regulator [Actinomyces vulturis]
MPKISGNNLAEHRQRTRTALFHALASLLSERSFDKITLSDVAARAGVGRTAVYNHVADKEDLLLAFIDDETQRYATTLANALQGIEDPVDRLRVYVREQALMTPRFHFPAHVRLSESVSRDTAGHLRSHGGRIADLLRAILKDAIDAKQIPDQNVDTLVNLIQATVLGGNTVPTQIHERAMYLRMLDTYVLRAVGAEISDHDVPAVDHSTMPQSMIHEAYRAQGISEQRSALRCPVAH